MAGYNATLTGATSAPLNVTDAIESRRYYESGAGDQEEYAARMLFVVLGPFFLIFGSAGNILSLVVLRSGEFKELSTCFYMSVLAVMDTGRFKLPFLLYIFKGHSLCRKFSKFCLIRRDQKILTEFYNGGL